MIFKNADNKYKENKPWNIFCSILMRHPVSVPSTGKLFLQLFAFPNVKTHSEPHPTFLLAVQCAVLSVQVQDFTLRSKHSGRVKIFLYPLLRRCQNKSCILHICPIIKLLIFWPFSSLRSSSFLSWGYFQFWSYLHFWIHVSFWGSPLFKVILIFLVVFILGLLLIFRFP